MTASSIQVLYEDNHLLVLNKPPLLATMGAESGMPTAVAWGKEYIKQKYQKPGNVFLGVVSRLDSFVSGALPLARTSKAAQRLTQAFAQRKVQKLYLAWVSGKLEPTRDRWVDWVKKNDRRKRMERVASGESGSQQAVLDFEVLTQSRGLSLVAIQLETGRKHQIRVQFADRGFPILGDRKYGGRPVDSDGIFLHCYRLRLPHPTQDRTVEIVADLPPHWYQRFPRLEESLARVTP
jgi:23S rRNA pseudouridine1911/1915/1917 synthase